MKTPAAVLADQHEAAREALLIADARLLRVRLHLLRLLRDASVDALTLSDGRIVRRKTWTPTHRIEYVAVEKGESMSSVKKPADPAAALKRLAGEIVAKATRLRNKADLVAGDPSPGRNLTALKTTAEEMILLLRRLRAPTEAP